MSLNITIILQLYRMIDKLIWKIYNSLKQLKTKEKIKMIKTFARVYIYIQGNLINEKIASIEMLLLMIDKEDR